MSSTIKLIKQIFKTNEEIVDSNLFIKVQGELFLMLVFCCSIISTIFNPIIWVSNSIMYHVGYSNICVAFDTFPANAVGLCFSIMMTYMIWRYNFLQMKMNTIKVKQGDIPYFQYYSLLVVNTLFCVSSVLFNLIFMMPPSHIFKEFVMHSIWFVIHLLARSFSRVVPLMFLWKQISIWDKVFTILYSISVFLYAVGVVLVFSGVYDNKPYWYIGMTIDYVHMFLLMFFNFLVKPLPDVLKITTKVINVRELI